MTSYLRAEVGAGAHVVLVNQIEWNLPAIKGEPDPADFLGIRPRRVDGDARQIHIDRVDLRRCATAVA